MTLKPPQRDRKYYIGFFIHVAMSLKNTLERTQECILVHHIFIDKRSHHRLHSRGHNQLEIPTTIDVQHQPPSDSHSHSAYEV